MAAEISNRQSLPPPKSITAPVDFKTQNRNQNSSKPGLRPSSTRLEDPSCGTMQIPQSSTL
jgi:hypothetical protein